MGPVINCKHLWLVEIILLTFFIASPIVADVVDESLNHRTQKLKNVTLPLTYAGIF